MDVRNSGPQQLISCHYRGLVVGKTHRHRQQNHSPPITSKLFRPYLDVEEASPKRPGSRVEDGEDEAPTAGKVDVVVERAEITSTDDHGPPATSDVGRKYGCDFCGRKFSRSNTLVTHRVCSSEASFSVAYQNLTGRVWLVFGSHVTWYTESYRSVTLVAFGRSLVYQVT